MENYSDLTKELIAPITDGSPCGEDPKYNNEFESAKAEVTKNSGRDYEAIVRDCNTIIAKQAKCVTTFSYYILAAAKADGIESLASVLEAYLHLAKEHWDDLHPKRERARINAIKWLNEDTVIGLLEQIPVTSNDYDFLLKSQAALTGLKDITFEKFPNSPPSIKNLIQLVDKWVKETKPTETPKAAAAPTAAPANTAAPAVAPAVVASSANTATAPSGDAGTLTDATKNIQKLALFYIDQAPTSPIGYRMLRMNKWTGIVQEPKNEGGKTLLKGPIPQRASYFETQIAQQNWEGVLAKSETAFTEPGFMYWFDLQNFVCKALRGSGKNKIAEAIEWEIHALVSNFPKILDLKFNDETPFASPQTKEWLEELSFGSGGGGDGAKSSSTKDVDLGADIETAKSLVGEQKFDQALSLINSGMHYSAPKQKAERKMEMARVCFQASMSDVAQPILEELQEAIAERSLWEWDPDFCEDAWELSLKNLDALINRAENDELNKSLIKKRHTIFHSISKLNPTKAIKFSTN
jgi:type VI secretion system protein VasJ